MLPDTSSLVSSAVSSGKEAARNQLQGKKKIISLHLFVPRHPAKQHPAPPTPGQTTQSKHIEPSSECSNIMAYPCPLPKKKHESASATGEL